MWQTKTKLDCGSVADKELDSGSVRDVELYCSSVADKELDSGSVRDIELYCSSVTDKELDSGSVAGPSTSTPIKNSADGDFPHHDIITIPFSETERTETTRKNIQAPLTANEETYLTKLTKLTLKMQKSDDRKTLRCKTGGQPIGLKRINHTA